MSQVLTAPDIAAIVGFAAKNKPYLFKQWVNKLMLREHGFDVRTGVKNKEPLMKLSAGSGLKPRTGKFVSKGDMLYSNRDLIVEEFQRDLAIDPKKFRTTYLGHLRGEGEGALNKKIPMQQLFNTVYMEKLAEEFVLSVIYHGLGKAAYTAYNAGSTYAVGDRISFTANSTNDDSSELRYYVCTVITTAGQNPETHPAKWQDESARAVTKGIGSYLATAITAGEVTPVTTGSITSSNAYDSCIAVYRDLDPAYKAANEILLYVSHDVYDALQDDVENTITKNFMVQQGLLKLPKTADKCKILPCTFMGTSSRIIATLPNNFIFGTDLESDMSDIDIQKQGYGLWYMTEGVVGLQIADTDAIACNDVV
jgi:hypothetical protein